MKFSINLLENDSNIKNEILNIFAKQADVVLQKTQAKILPKIQLLLEDSLKQEPEYISLTSGQLRLEFGIPNIASVDNIVKKLAATAKIDYKKTIVQNNGISAGLILTALERTTMGGLIEDSDAVVIDSKGYSLSWLKWLLYDSNNPIIRNYEVKIGPNSNSRTGMAIMIESKKNWRVPAAFAGTINNNWIVRAIDRVSNNINKIIRESFESSL